MEETFIIHESIVTESPSRIISHLEDIIQNYHDQYNETDSQSQADSQSCSQFQMGDLSLQNESDMMCH